MTLKNDNAGELININPYAHKKLIMDGIRERLFQKLSDPESK